mmetsp:Transcript_15285/g.27240  ORF Transcript_15285/g.27240 Transcript_15285/m.27240 type:complete len:679 (-) Transcript_15285:36-2072(-)
MPNPDRPRPPLLNVGNNNNVSRGGEPSPKDVADDSGPVGDSGYSDHLSQEAAALLDGAMGLFDEGDYAGALLEDAMMKFEAGDYAEAEQAAAEAIAAKQADQSQSIAQEEQMMARLSAFTGDEVAMDGKYDRWKMALGRLATAYEDTGDFDLAESVYLRMLAWNEGNEQHRAGKSRLASKLFNSSSNLVNTDDATWFLRGLKPDDGHAVPEVVVLLALGERVAAKAAVAVYTLALRAKHRPQLSECGAVELLTKAIAIHVDNAELQAAGCGALKLLCHGHELAVRNRQSLVLELDCPQALVAAMRCHRDDSEVLREAAGALSAIACDNPVGAARIVYSNGISVCLESIRGCQDQALGDAVCRAIATLCGRGSSTALGSTGKLDTDGDVEWQVALRSECEHGLRFCIDYLQEQAAKTVGAEHEARRLAESPQLRESREEAADTVVSRAALAAFLMAAMIFLDDGSIRHQALDMVPSVVSCMTKFQGAPQVQVPACGVLWRLTTGHNARDAAVQQVASSGGILALCQAMRDLPTQLDLQQLAIGALRNLSFGNDDNKTRAVKANGIQAIVLAMKRYPKDSKLQEQAIGALTSLCDTVGRAQICARLGGIDAIIAALRRHSQTGHIAELGCIVLCMFCDDGMLKHHIKTAGALPVAKALTRTENDEARTWGSELLRDLSEH